MNINFISLITLVLIGVASYFMSSKQYLLMTIAVVMLLPSFVFFIVVRVIERLATEHARQEEALEKLFKRVSKKIDIVTVKIKGVERRIEWLSTQSYAYDDTLMYCPLNYLYATAICRRCRLLEKKSRLIDRERRLVTALTRMSIPRVLAELNIGDYPGHRPQKMKEQY